MNRNLRESLSGGRNLPAISQFRRGTNNLSLNGFPRDSDENLDLFSKIRRSFPLASSDELPEVSAKLGRLSVGSKTAPKSGGAEDFLSSGEGGKNDYDWLLTPPGTPLGSESHSSLAAPKTTSSARPSSASKTSRLSVSQSESSFHSSRPARSSSATRPSISTSQYSSFSSSRSPSSILNTSSASVSSYIRPSSPSSRTSSTARPSTPTRTSSSRASTPSRIRPGSSSSSMDKTRPSLTSLSSRPSTPTSRPQISASSPNLIASRPNSRPSTPTRRSPSTSLSAPSVSNGSSGRAASNGRTAPTLSRPSSPAARVRTPQQPISLPDFPLDTPPNLRTTLPDRPISAGRSRPVAGTTAKASPEPKGPITRRNSSPIVSRGRLSETPGKGRVSNNHLTDAPESRRISNVSDITSRRTQQKSSSVIENTGLGRSFSKSSLDMAIRHMDIRNGKSNGCAALSTTTLFPQSIRSTSSKIQPIRSGIHSDSNSGNGTLQGAEFTEYGNSNNGNGTNEGRLSGKLSEMDMYESSRYDALLLKEDVKNTNWLHSIDDRSSDHGLMFDNGFELLPEPFAPI